jgi:hypothetical protein
MQNGRSVRSWQAQARSALAELFVDHPHTLGESYWQHQAHATRFGTTLIAAGFACLVHGVIPALFARTGSSTVAALHEQMRVRMGRAERVALTGGSEPTFSGPRRSSASPV